MRWTNNARIAFEEAENVAEQRVPPDDGLLPVVLMMVGSSISQHLSDISENLDRIRKQLEEQ